MALYAFDGTWKDDKSGDVLYDNTNVVRFHDAYQQTSGKPQFYAPGVGARCEAVEQLLGGALGLGELSRLEEAYSALCQTWATGDQIIDIVGFSRGAATTLDFCRMIQDRGIRKPASGETVTANPQIRFLGVWDVVDAFGLGCLGVAEFSFGHALTLPNSRLQYAFHALALDERRPSFLPTRLRGACEVWFRGVHSDIGGGDENRGLNDITLKWMMGKAPAAGLPITQTQVDALAPNPQSPPQLGPERDLLNVRIVSDTDRRHYTVTLLAGFRNPADTCPVETPEDEQRAVLIADALEVIPPDVRARIAVLVATALTTAQQLDVSLAGVYEGLFDLIEHRVILVTDDAALTRAKDATVQLVEEIVRQAQAKQFVVLNDYFLTAALFQLAPLFPYTD